MKFAGSLENWIACTCQRAESTGGLCSEPVLNHSQPVCSLQAVQLSNIMHAESCLLRPVKPLQARRRGSILHSVGARTTATEVPAAFGFPYLHLSHAVPADVSALPPQLDPLQAWQRRSSCADHSCGSRSTGWVYDEVRVMPASHTKWIECVVQHLLIEGRGGALQTELHIQLMPCVMGATEVSSIHVFSQCTGCAA